MKVYEITIERFVDKRHMQCNLHETDIEVKITAQTKVKPAKTFAIYTDEFKQELQKYVRVQVDGRWYLVKKFYKTYALVRGEIVLTGYVHDENVVAIYDTDPETLEKLACNYSFENVNISNPEYKIVMFAGSNVLMLVKKEE